MGGGGGRWRGSGTMPVMRRIAGGLCVLIVAVLGVSGCAAPGSTPEGGPSASAAWVTYEAQVSTVTPGPGAKAVTVHVLALAGGDDCSRNVRVSNQDEVNGVIFANLVQDSAESAQPGGCPALQSVAVRLTSAKPIGTRPLTLNQQAWALDGGAYRRCDENLGCAPPKNRCDPVWTRAAVRGMDVSSHSQGTVEACQGDWLVMTVPDDPAACGAGGRPGCEVNTAVRRYFLRNKPAGWLIVAQTTAGGCDAVLVAAPDFPRKLCAGLQPTSRFISSAPTLAPSARPGG